MSGRWDKDGAGEWAGDETAGVEVREEDCDCDCDNLGGGWGPPALRECVRGGGTITSEEGCGRCDGLGSGTEAALSVYAGCE